MSKTDCTLIMFGLVQVIEVDLKPGGRDIPVTEDNKKEYVG